MNYFEKLEIRDFVKRWQAELSPAYKNAWAEFIRKRDIVAKEMRLTEEQLLIITKYQIALYVMYDYRRRMGIVDEETKKAAVNRRGTTRGLEIAGNMARIVKGYRESEYFHLINTVGKNIDNLTSRR